MEFFPGTLAKWVFARVPFGFALIGFEATPSPKLLQSIRAGAIPRDRDEGILWNDAGTLMWYPATPP
jgi:hypothetical protein